MSLCADCKNKESCTFIKEFGAEIDCSNRVVKKAPKSYDVVTDGYKHDGGKPRLSLVPPILIRAVGTVMTHGAEKYGEGNWKNVEPERYRDALARHYCDYMEDPYGVDKQSGLPHLYHLACNVAFLLELEKEIKNEQGD